MFATGSPSHTEQIPAGKALGSTCTTAWTDQAALEGRLVGVLSGHDQTGGAGDVIHEEWSGWQTVIPPGMPSSIRAPRRMYSRSLDRAGSLQKLIATKASFDNYGNPTSFTNLGETIPIAPSCSRPKSSVS